MRSNVVPMHADQILYPDPTDWCQHRIIEIAGDFEVAITYARTSARCMQLAERLKMAVELLQHAENDARLKANRL